MSESQSTVNDTAPAGAVGLSAQEEQLKVGALIAYGLMIVGMFTGIFFIAGAIWAMIKKSDAAGTIFESHYSNIIKTFWWGLGLSILGFFTTFIVIGFFILFAVWIWTIYRLIKGLAKITSNKDYYA